MMTVTSEDPSKGREITIRTSTVPPTLGGRDSRRNKGWGGKVRHSVAPSIIDHHSLVVNNMSCNSPLIPFESNQCVKVCESCTVVIDSMMLS